MNTSELALALSGIALQGGLCIFLLVRGFQRPFRSFVAYTLFSVVASVAGLLVRNFPRVYLYFYWTSELIYIVLALAALQEIIYMVFRNFYTMRWFRLIFPAMGVSMILLASLRVVLATGRTNRNPILEIVISMEILVRMLQFGLLILFFILVWFFHMRWRQIPLGIALGFGIGAAGFLVVFLLRSEFGTEFDPVVRIAPPITYIIAVLIWLATFLRGEPSQPEAKVDVAFTPEQMLFEVRRYTRAVKGMLGR
jgi:hypothetical protein